jgi:hypothetical protein
MSAVIRPLQLASRIDMKWIFRLLANAKFTLIRACRVELVQSLKVRNVDHGGVAGIRHFGVIEVILDILEPRGMRPDLDGSAAVIS